MKLDVVNLKNNFQKPVQANVLNNVSNAANVSKGQDILTAPTQINPSGIEGGISSAASNPINAQAADALKAQTLAQAPITYKFERDINLAFSNKAKLYTLANGQKVVILEKKGPTVLETYYNVGSMNEPDDKRGISHFEEHMAFNGSQDPNGQGLGAGDFFKIVNKLGAMTNASTSFSQTNYFITSQLLGKGNVFDTSAYLQSQQLQYPKHAEDMIEKEKGPVTQEISMVGDQPENAAMNQCIKNLFNIETTSPDLVAGTISNINKLTREDTQEYYNLWYTPDNSVTVVTGEVPEQEAVNTIAKYFNKSSYVPVQNRKYQDFNPLQKTVRVDIKAPRAQSSTAVIGFSGPNNNSTKENITMEVLLTALLGYKGARIRKELNKIQSSAVMNVERVGNRPTDPRAVLIASQSTPQKTEEVLKTIYNEIGNVQANPLSAEELATAKKILKMTFSKISEDSQLLNTVLGNAVLDNDLDYVEKYLEILDSITSADVSAFAQKYLDLNKASIAVVHPASLSDSDISKNYQKANNITAAKPAATPKVAFKGRLEDKKLDTSKIKQYRLANNMEVVLNPNKSDLASSAITLSAPAPANVKPGVPALMAVILNEGTIDKNYDAFYKDVHKTGMSLKFDANYNSISAEVESLASDFGYSLDLIKEVLTKPRFNENSLTYAKKLIKESVLNIPNSASEPMSRELFPSLNEFATREEILAAIDNITLQDITEFYNYIKNNAMAKGVFTAPLEKDASIEQSVINKLSVGLRNFKPFNVEHFKTYEPIKEHKVITKAEPRNQADIVQAFKFKTNYNPKDQMSFLLLNTILGGGPSSRLFEDLRESQKLAYRVESDLDFVGDTGVVSLAIKTTTDNPTENIQLYDNVEKSLNGFKKHIDKFKAEKVSQEELDAAKLRIKTKLLNSMESSEGQTLVLSSAKDNITGINSVNENLKIIDSITPEDIQNAANYVFAGNSVTSILASQNTIDYFNKKV